MQIEKQFSLKSFNTFGIDAYADLFTRVNGLEDAQELISSTLFKSNKRLILGGGSNVLLTKNFDGLVIKVGFEGISLVEEDSSHYYVKAGAGENWHSFVLHCIENNYGGIENLSLIPGNVGAAPMQNIGAYGVELKDVFYKLEAIDLVSGAIQTFNNAACQFGYRESVFKKALKNQYLIASVTLKLSKSHKLNTSYGAIEKELDVLGVTKPTIQDISRAVCNIRRSKLPDPNEIGNAGSFFKNPVIGREQFNQLKKEFPQVANYPVDEEHVKVAAGWLIEHAGWKGKTFESYGVHKKQALVLVNYGEASGKDIYDLSEEIMASIHSTFGIQLEREVNVV